MNWESDHVNQPIYMMTGLFNSSFWKDIGQCCKEDHCCL